MSCSITPPAEGGGMVVPGGVVDRDLYLGRGPRPKRLQNKKMPRSYYIEEVIRFLASSGRGAKIF